MAQQVRMQTECPPDAHKVIRPPENDVQATLCVKLNEDEAKKYGIIDFCNVLALMSAKPLVMCSPELKEEIEKNKAEAEIEPGYLKIDGDDAFITYGDGSVGSCMPFFDLAANPDKASQFFDELSKKQFLIIDSLSMLTLRSISTVYPWDKLLAGDFLRQYLKARADLNDKDIETLTEVRYGRKEGYALKDTDPAAYMFQRLERKLFLQYPTDDDD